MYLKLLSKTEDVDMESSLSKDLLELTVENNSKNHDPLVREDIEVNI